jgi:large subunit ribosomal protein L6
MKTEIIKDIEFPEGISAKLDNNLLTLSKGKANLSKDIFLPRVKPSLSANKLTFVSKKGNKNQLKQIMSLLAHIRNMILGMNNKFVYKMQECHVHFPMTLKVEKNRLVINNFLGERTPRYAEILPNVDVEIKGANITIRSHDKDAAGHTVSNFEKATKIKERDRRVFQDGLFLTEKTTEEVK